MMTYSYSDGELYYFLQDIQLIQSMGGCESARERVKEFWARISRRRKFKLEEFDQNVEERRAAICMTLKAPWKETVREVVNA